MDEYIDHLCTKEKFDTCEKVKKILLNQANKFTKLITEKKQIYIIKMSSKLDCHDTSAKTYWSIKKRFLNRKRCQIYRLSLLTANSYQIIMKKLNYLIETCGIMYVVQNTSTLPVFNFKQIIH